jgi:hypothetical protein
MRSKGALLEEREIAFKLVLAIVVVQSAMRHIFRPPINGLFKDMDDLS